MDLSRVIIIIEVLSLLFFWHVVILLAVSFTFAGFYLTLKKSIINRPSNLMFAATCLKLLNVLCQKSAKTAVLSLMDEGLRIKTVNVLILLILKN